LANEFSLILGCGGRVINGLTICSATINVIINFDCHIEPEPLEKVMSFLDDCGLFDAVMMDWNKVVNTLKVLRERYNLITDKTWSVLHTWFVRHKECGGYLRLVLNSEIHSFIEEGISMPHNVK
jgi:hypothetical protein